jgi:ferredoxin/flavodoxin---NADP+ reductase
MTTDIMLEREATTLGATDFDIVVVGAGPVGLYAAYYAGFRGLRVAIIDPLPQVGGQVTALYPEKLIHDVAGFRSIRGQDLVDGLVDQVSQWEPTLVLSELAQELLGDDDLVLTLANGRALTTRGVILAAGLGSVSPKPLPAAKSFQGCGLVHFVPSLDAFDDQEVVVVGGGDSAVDWALAAADRAKTVTLVHRRRGFRAHQASLDALGRTDVRQILEAEISEIHGVSAVEAVSVRSPDNGEVELLSCGFLVAALGFNTALGPIASWGLEMNGRHVAVDPSMRTSRPRVYAAGDVSEYTGKVRLISVGFGEAAIAVNHLAHDLDPDAGVFPGHSTNEGG